MTVNKIQLRPRALKDLEDIYEYSVREFGSSRATKYIEDLDRAFYKIAENPLVASDYSHIRSGLFAFRVVSHIVFFKNAPNGIIIIRVLHKSMDYSQHI